MSTLEESNGPLPPWLLAWPAEMQLRIQSAVGTASLEAIARANPFPDWLGYLGLALYYTQTAESRNAILTRALCPQLLTFVSDGSSAYTTLMDMISNSSAMADDKRETSPVARYLRWQDLQQIEDDIVPYWGFGRTV